MTTQQSAPRRNIVVGVDGSPSSLDALRWAACMAVPLNAEIDAVTSWDYPASYGMGGGAPADWDPAEDAARILADALTAAFGDHRPAGIRAAVYEGHPARVLSNASNGAEMLVVGSRGHGGFAGLLLGSVSAYCTAHAPCPVLVVRTTPPAPVEFDGAGDQAAS
ncbi:MAG: universal stress protein [Actinomycetota bacterium]|nr:universal stress protein [Actinomycetota bacterium]